MITSAPQIQVNEPSALEAEHSVLGSALYDNDACEELFERLRPEHFGEPVHARIWECVLDLRRKGNLVEPIAIKTALASDIGFQEIGALRFLAELIDKANVWAVNSHADALVDTYTRREIHRLGRRVGDMAMLASDMSADQILGELERGAAEIAREGSTRSPIVPAGLTALETMEAAWRGEYLGTPTGLETIDRVTGGIRQDDVWFVGGRTSMGKSVVGLALARGLAEQGRGVVVFSLEMPLREVQARIVSDMAFEPELQYDAYDSNIRYSDLLKGRGTPQQKDRAIAAAKRLAGLPIAVTDTGGLTVDDIRIQAQRQMRAWSKSGVKPGAIIVDHIGLVKPHTNRGDSKAAETADTVNELKSIAKQLRCPIIALAQVNRNTESRNDKRPTLADLNWSGAIEQIADFICLLYREAYYLERSPSQEDQDRAQGVANVIDLLIHKNRSGPICSLKAFVDVACNAVRDLPDDGVRR